MSFEPAHRGMCGRSRSSCGCRCTPPVCSCKRATTDELACSREGPPRLRHSRILTTTVSDPELLPERRRPRRSLVELMRTRCELNATRCAAPQVMGECHRLAPPAGAGSFASTHTDPCDPRNRRCHGSLNTPRGTAPRAGRGVHGPAAVATNQALRGPPEATDMVVHRWCRRVALTRSGRGALRFAQLP